MTVSAADPNYVKELQAWRELHETNLRSDNGWLTLVGRFTLKPGDNTFGTGQDNDVVFPTELKGIGPERLGVLNVDEANKRVTLKLADQVTMTSGKNSFAGERVFNTTKPDWVGLGRLQMHIIERDGKFVLRLADNESTVRKSFPGCIWYPADERFKFTATFIPYPAGKTIRVVNVLDQSSQQPCPGYAEFAFNGQTYRLDAIAEGEGLFFVFRDETAGETTYQPARFLTVDTKPKDNATFILDFNKAYNPPCAVSEFTTCPTAPRQNILKIRIEAGEKYKFR